MLFRSENFSNQKDINSSMTIEITDNIKINDMKKLCGYIKTQEEAMLIVHAVRFKLFEPAKDRLTLDQREMIRSGSIFCFIESDEGMKRWTDGKIWSPSKIVGHFLLYKEVPKHLSKSALKKDRRYPDAQKKRLNYFPYEKRSNDLFNEEFTLFKKTISISHDKKNYHVIAYYQPFFEKRSLTSIKFFKDLQTVLTVHPELKSDEFLQEMTSKGKDLVEEFKIPIPTTSNVLPAIDRLELEKTAISVLNSNLRPNYMQREV